MKPINSLTGSKISNTNKYFTIPSDLYLISVIFYIRPNLQQKVSRNDQEPQIYLSLYRKITEKMLQRDLENLK